MANYRKRNDTEAIKRLRELWRTYRKLWRNMTILAKLVLDKGGIIAIEWPRGCSYWRDGCVRRFVAEHMLRAYDFDGC
eukprot:1526601-Prorocentrum_lima.AAC.1